MKATEQYFRVVLFNVLYKLVLTFESIGEIPKCLFFLFFVFYIFQKEIWNFCTLGGVELAARVKIVLFANIRNDDTKKMSTLSKL